MIISREATAALNEYLDRVRLALPLPPSQHLPVVDKLYRQILANCEDRARETNKLQIDLETVQSCLTSLGPPEQQGELLAAAQNDQRWSTDAFTFDRQSVGEKASSFAKAAAERGEYVAKMSMEAAANALDLAAQKLREAAEKMKAKT